MAILEIKRMGHPILRQKAAQIPPEEITGKKIQTLIQNMIETMRAADGLGLAAPQVGESVALAIIEIPCESKRYKETSPSPLMILINPKITIVDKALQGYWEGCLSVPHLRGFVERPRKIQVDYFNDRGESQSVQMEGFLSTVFQHELDHLQGKLYLDRMSDLTKLSFEKEWSEFFTTHSEKID